MTEVSKRRVFVGGLFPDVTDSDLKDRFQRFGDVTSVEVKRKQSQEGFAAKTFAYLDIDVSEDNYKKCLNVYNNTKWKGGIVTIQPAKESFLTRLKGERAEALENDILANIPKIETNSDDNPSHPRVEQRFENFNKAGVKDYHVEKAVPGTTIEGEKNWIVGKYGRVMPIVYIRRPDKKKIMKVDPSKYVHHLKVMKDTESKMADSDDVSELTWNVPERTSSNYKKRKGEFMPNKKKPQAIPNKVLKKTLSSEDECEVNLPEKKSETIDIQDKRKIAAIHKEDSSSSNGKKADDLEVVEVKSLGSIGISSYLLNLNRRSRQQSNHGNTQDDENITPLKATYDSDNESCSSADTDEILCSAKKRVVSEGTPQVITDGSITKLTQTIEQNQSRTHGNVVLSGNVKSSTFFDSDSASDESEELKTPNMLSSFKIDNERNSGNTSKELLQNSASKPTIAAKISKKSLASFMGETSSDESYVSCASSIESSDNEDVEKTGQNAQASPASNQTIASKVTGKDLVMLKGETSSENSDASSVASSGENIDDDDDSGSEKEAITATGQNVQPKSASKQTVAPKIIEKDLASFTREASDKSSDESSDENSDDSDHDETEDKSSKKMILGQNLQQKSDLKQTIAPKIAGKDLASLMGETSSDESSDESSDNSSDDSDDDKTEDKSSKKMILGQNLQQKSDLKQTIAPKIAGKDLASLMGETSSDESSDESSDKNSDDSDDDESETEEKTSKKLIAGQNLQPKSNLKQTIAPKIAGKDLASLMGETSSDESSDDSSDKNSDDSDTEDKTSDQMISGQNLQPKSNLKQIIAPKITGKDLASLMGETSSDESSDESSVESVAESSDDDSESDEENTDDEDSSDTDSDDGNSKRQATEIMDVKQNCAVINAILSDESPSLSKNLQSVSKNSQNLSVLNKAKEVAPSNASSKTDPDHRTKKNGKTEQKKTNLKSAASDMSKSTTSASSPLKKNALKDTVESRKKKALDNEARLETLKRKRSEMSKQQALIHDALLDLDAKDAPTPGKHFRFDSDDSDNDDEAEMDKEKLTELNQEKLTEKNDVSKKTSFQLFDSDEDMDDGTGAQKDDDDDGIQFEKPQYEGKHGAKLMKMQSRFGGDSRFKMDTNFLEDDAETDSNKSDDKEDIDPEDVDLREERKRSLAILEKIVGTRAMAKHKPLNDGRNAFKDLSTLRYDPSKKEHVKFEQKFVEPESTERDEVTTKVQREEAPAPEVSKDKFYEVSTSLKSAFGSGGGSSLEAVADDNAPFTFFAQEDDEEGDEKPLEDKTADSEATPLSTLDLMWKTKKFAYDSSGSEKEDDEQDSVAASKKTKKRVASDSKDTDTTAKDELPPRKFFFQPDDIRLREGPLWFFNVPKAAHHQERMEERKEELKAGFRNRHKRAVRTWNRKKMEKQIRKPKW